jgi:hypothetical protein
VTFEEKLPAFILASLILFLGIQPNWLVKWGEPTATGMIAALPTVVNEAVADEIPPAPAPIIPPLGTLPAAMTRGNISLTHGWWTSPILR